MKLQKNTSLALYSVLEIAAAPTRHIPGAEIAAKYDVSSHHLAKVLSELARAGVVESVRGVGGGYRFTGNARRLTLMDIIQMFEDPGSSDPDRRDAGEATPVGRALGAVLLEIDEIARATFRSITLATMQRLIERQRAEAEAAAARTPTRGEASPPTARRARRARRPRQ